MSGIFGLIYNDPKQKDLIYKMSLSYGDSHACQYVFPASAALGVKKKPVNTGRPDEYAITADINIHVVFSGEIINRKEIIDARQDILTQRSGDAEIFGCLFEQYGSDCIKKINSQFSAAVWLAKRKRLHLLLDRVGGLQNIYYVSLNRGFAFSSRLHSLLAIPGVKRKINQNSLVSLFTTGRILPPDSLVKNIYKVRPGEEVVYENGRLRTRIVDRIDFTPKGVKKNEAGELCNRLVESVKNFSREDETSFLLSGGIDSSTLVALASQKLYKNVRTFTAAFPGSDLDESPYAEIVARANSCKNDIIEPGDSSFLDDLPEIVWHLDEPFLDFSVIPTYHLFKEIKKQTPIVISGDGPDHLFGRYYPLAAKRYLANKIQFFNILFDKVSIPFLQKIGRASNCELQAAYNDIFIIPAWGIENADSMMDLFAYENAQFVKGDIYFADETNPREGSFDEIFAAFSYIDFYVDGSFGVFSKVGKMAAAHDLVVREPYLERGVSDFIASLPVRSRVKGNGLHLLLSMAKVKYLLKHELGPKILPPEIINKRKGGFTPPLKVWLRERICKIPIDKLLCPTVINSGFFNSSYVDKILVEHANGTRDWSTIIFMLISFDLWVRMLIENNCEKFPGWKLTEIYS